MPYPNEPANVRYANDSDVNFGKYLKTYFHNQGYALADADQKSGYKYVDDATYNQLLNQARYNYKAGQNYEYGDTAYDPWSHAADENDAWANFYKTNNRKPTADEFKKTYAVDYLYKGQYGNTVEDKANEAAGLPPMKIQYSKKMVDEYNALVREAKAGNLSAEKARQIAPSLFEVTEYAKAQAAKRAEDAAAGKETRKWSFQGSKAAEDNGLDPDVLKALGYDENTGFASLFEGLPQTGVDIMEQQNLINRKYPDMRNFGKAGQPSARPITVQPGQDIRDQALNAAVMAGVPQQSQQPQRQPTQAEINAMTGVGMPTARGDETFGTNLAASALGASGVLGRNAVQTALNLKQGKPVEWKGNINPLTGKWENTPQTMDMVNQALDYGIANNKIDPIFGNVEDQKRLKEILANSPWAQTLYTILGDTVMDPGLFVGSGIGTKIAGITKAIKAGKEAEAMALLDDLARVRQEESALVRATGIPKPAAAVTRETPGMVTPAEASSLGLGKVRPLSAETRALQWRESGGTVYADSATGGGFEINRATGDMNYISPDGTASSVGKFNSVDEAQRAAEELVSGRAPTVSNAQADFYGTPEGTVSTSTEGQRLLPAGEPSPTTIRKPAFSPRQFTETPDQYNFRGLGPARPLPEPSTAVSTSRLGPGKPITGVQAKRAAQTAVEAPGARSVAQEATGATETSGRAQAAKPVGTPGQSAYDLQNPLPEGMKERGVSENIRTDANSPAALRTDFAKDPLVYQAAGNEETLNKAQQVFDDTYAKGDVEGAIGRATELVDQMKPEAAPLSVMIARELRQGGNAERARQVLSYAAEKATSAGQYGQAFKILRSSDPETLMLTIERQLRKFNADGAAMYGKKWTDFNLTPSEVDMIGKLPVGDPTAFENAMAQIQRRIASQMPATALEKFKGLRDISMLLNPKTQIRNFLGNVVMMGMRKTAGKVSAVLQGGTKLVARAIGKEFKPTEAVWIKHEYRDLATEAFNARKGDLLREGSKYQEGIRLNMAGKRVFQARPLEAVRKTTYKLLEWGDNPFYKSAYIDRLGAYMQARGIKSLDNIPTEALDLAKKAAEQATFKDASWLSNMIAKGKTVPAGAGLGRKTLSTALEAVAPYTKTPINIVQRGIQYSPAGIVNGLSKIGREGGAAALDEIAKGLTGTAIVGLGYFLASKGFLTGSAAKDTDMAAYDKATGNSPFSILGKYTYDWIQPFSIPLSIGVEIWNAVKEDPAKQKQLDMIAENPNGKQWTDIISDATTGVISAIGAAGDTVYNMSVLQGAQDLFGGSQGFMEGLMRLPFNYALQFVPTLSGQLARTLDPIQRQTYYGAGTVGEFLKTEYATFASRIPGLSQTLQPKTTTAGKPMTGVERPGLRAVQQFVSPGAIAVPQEVDPRVDAEIRRLAATGEKSQFPRVAERSFSYKTSTGAQSKVMLSEKDYTQYQMDLGQESERRFKAIIQTPEYKKLSDPDKAKAISNEFTYANNYAQYQYLKRSKLIPAGILNQTTWGWAKILAQMLGTSMEDAKAMTK